MIKVEALLTEAGYTLVNMKPAKADRPRELTLEKDGQKVVVNDQLIADVAALAAGEPLQFSERSGKAA